METCYDARRIVVKSSVQRDGVDVFILAASAAGRSQAACSMTLSRKPNVSGQLRLESGGNYLDTRRVCAHVSCRAGRRSQGGFVPLHRGGRACLFAGACRRSGQDRRGRAVAARQCWPYAHRHAGRVLRRGASMADLRRAWSSVACAILAGAPRPGMSIGPSGPAPVDRPKKNRSGLASGAAS